MATETPGYIPISQWPTLEELAAGYSEHLMPQSQSLSNKLLQLFTDDGFQIAHHFIDANKLRWTVTEGPEHKGVTGDAEYKAFEVRRDIFFVDFYKPTYEEQVSLVLNLATRQAIVGVSGFKDEAGTRRTWTRFNHASINHPESIEPFPLTDEMIGKHVLYRYTPRDSYEHVYLNQGTFTWHCLSGTEKGLADTEPCKMLKLGDKLYLLFWSETVIPVESVVVVDLEQMRSTGRFFCWDPKPQRAVHMLFGSYATLLADVANVSKHLGYLSSQL